MTAEKYFTQLYPPSIQGYSEMELKFIQIRHHIHDHLNKGNFEKVEGIILGVLYGTSKSFAEKLILWENSYHGEGSEPSLLHEVLDIPDEDPPISLLQLILDLAPDALMQEDATGHLPLHTAIHSYGSGGRSLKIVRLLVEADKEKDSLVVDTGAMFRPLTDCVFRGDDDVARYLLEFEEARSTLINDKKGPLYYASRNLLKDRSPITPFLRLWIEETAKELREQDNDEEDGSSSSCCLYSDVLICSDYVFDIDALLDVVIRDNHYCGRHGKLR